jgi:hypothetical protein
MPAPVLQFKRGNAGVAGTVPALRPGEPAISLNNFDLFIGINTSVANNKFFGSHRYWSREDGTNSLRLKLVDKDGSNSINLKSPDTLSGITTYTLPETPVNGYFLKTNSTGILSWAEVVSNFNIAADTGTPDNVSTGSTVTFIGGTNVNTAVSDNAITINLDENISVTGIMTVGTSLSSPTIKVATLQHSNGTQAASIDTSGNIIASQNLTISGNLYVNGSTTQVNTTELTVNDRTITLGIQTGSTPITTTWDLGILMNYGDAGTAKTSGVIWEHTAKRFLFSANSDNPASTSSSTPNITVATFAPIEIAELWFNNTCTGGSQQVISCVGSELQLQSIVIDAGSY